MAYSLITDFKEGPSMDQTLILFMPHEEKTRNLNSVVMEFHISRNARDRYGFEESLYSLSGNVIFANFRAARVFAQKMNEKKDLDHFPEQAVIPGQINAMGLIDEILHF